MFNANFLKDVLERAIWTAAQAFLAVYTVGDLASAKAAGVAAVGALGVTLHPLAFSSASEKATCDDW